jgi:hypothetical protein
MVIILLQIERISNHPNTGETVCNDYLFGDESIWWCLMILGR